MKRLFYFPEPYPDEDFRSIIYRYHLRSSNSSLRDTNLELFEKKSERIPILPYKLETLHEKLPYHHSYTIEELLLNHTWSGLLQAFMSKDKEKGFLDNIRNGLEINTGAGSFIPLNFFSKTIKYCPLCMKEDIDNYGECYVHKKHQLNFMGFCYKHLVDLEEKCTIGDTVQLGNKNYQRLVTPLACLENNNISHERVLDKEKQLKIEIFKIICFINDNFPGTNLEIIYHKILMGLWGNNFIHYNGRILKKELVSSMISHYELDFLKAFHLDPKHILQKSFFKKIFGNDLVHDILFYSLVIHFLFNSISKFMSTQITIANHIPFGSGPWKCFNRICIGYNKHVISKVKRSSFKPTVKLVMTGEFVCPLCGQIYAKVWNCNKVNGEKVIIKTMGEMWINMVLDLYLKGHSSNQIATKLKCSETAVRNNLKNIFGSSKILKEEDSEVVSQIINAYKETASANEVQRKKESYRNHILEIMRMYPSLKRTDINSMITKEYQWLKRNDEDWLEKVLPPKRRPGKHLLDFTLFDKQLALKIKKVNKEMLSEYPRQIGKRTILNKLTSIERNRLLLFPDRLPLSALSLSQSTESFDTYLIRTLPFSVKSILSYGYKNVSLEKLKRVFPKYRKCNFETEVVIKKTLNEMGYIE